VILGSQSSTRGRGSLDVIVAEGLGFTLDGVAALLGGPTATSRAGHQPCHSPWHKVLPVLSEIANVVQSTVTRREVGAGVLTHAPSHRGASLMRCLGPYRVHPLLGVRPALEDPMSATSGPSRRGPSVPSLLEAVVEEPGNGVAVLDRTWTATRRGAQHDLCGQARAAGPHRHCPDLEQLGRRTLDEGITAVAAPGRGRPTASRVPTRCHYGPG